MSASASTAIAFPSKINFNYPLRFQRRLLLLTPRATAPNTGKDSKNETEDDRRQSLSLDDVNPVGLGRRSRQLFDDVWRKFSGLGQISRTIRTDDQETLDALLVREGPMCEFAVPGAQNTTVLVVGATSRIGRIVVRKLMLRGYTVKVSNEIKFNHVTVSINELFFFFFLQ